MRSGAGRTTSACTLARCSFPQTRASEASADRSVSADRSWRCRSWRCAGVAALCCAVLVLCCTASAALAANPTIVEESVTEVGATAATLQARIEPNGADTSAYFQYSVSSTATCAPTTCADVPAPPGVRVEASGEAEVSGQQAQGLAPATVYHYRVVAVSRVEVEVEPGKTEAKTEEFDGPDQTFTTQWVGLFALPDDRRWEMVSPPEKLGARFAAQGQKTGSEGDLVQAAARGNAITYVAYSPIEAGPSGYSGGVQVLSARGPSGWRSWDLTIPHEAATGASTGKGNEYRFFSEDLSVGILQPFGAFDPSLSPEAAEQTPFLHTDYTGAGERCEQPARASCYRPLVTGVELSGAQFGEDEQCPPRLVCGPRFEGATPDGSHVVLHIEPVPGRPGLYEWSTDGQLQFVDEDAALGTNEASDTWHAISDNGSRVFVAQGATISSPGELFMVEPALNRRLELDLRSPECPGCAGGRGAFQGASNDGSRVFFEDELRLTADSGAGFLEPDLYECHIVEEDGEPTCALTDLTPRNAGENARVQGRVLGMSEDGSWVYFVADGVLENENAEGRKEPVPGAVRGTCQDNLSSPSALCNLYVRHDGVTRLVAVISGRDDPDWGVGSGTISPEELVARVSPTGKWLTFMSARELTGYDNRDVVSGQPDEEVYLYDGEAAKLVCASCEPTAARPRGETVSAPVTGDPNMPLVDQNVSWTLSNLEQTPLAASLPGWTKDTLTRASYQPRFLSDNGRLFFNSYDALVPQDNNGNWDVYEYEPPGVGSCLRSSATFSERSGGCVGLISSGTFDGESAFMDASANGGRAAEGDEEGGGDVFFITAAPLALQDTDDDVDVYDARECTTESPCLPPAAEAPPPCATADECRAAPTPQPEVFGAPASATFSGPGNLSPAAPAPPAAKPKTVAQIKAEELVGALKACRMKVSPKKRDACEASARRRYGTVAKTRRKAKSKAGRSASHGSGGASHGSGGR